MKQQKVPIGTRALIGRLNRAMADDDLVVRKSRPGSRLEIDVGTYYLLNTRINGIARHDVDLEALAKEYEVLQPYEELADD